MKFIVLDSNAKSVKLSKDTQVYKSVFDAFLNAFDEGEVSDFKIYFCTDDKVNELDDICRLKTVTVLKNSRAYRQEYLTLSTPEEIGVPAIGKWIKMGGNESIVQHLLSIGELIVPTKKKVDRRLVFISLVWLNTDLAQEIIAKYAIDEDNLHSSLMALSEEQIVLLEKELFNKHNIEEALRTNPMPYSYTKNVFNTEYVSLQHIFEKRLITPRERISYYDFIKSAVHLLFDKTPVGSQNHPSSELDEIILAIAKLREDKTVINVTPVISNGYPTLMVDRLKSKPV